MLRSDLDNRLTSSNKLRAVSRVNIDLVETTDRARTEN